MPTPAEREHEYNTIRQSIIPDFRAGGSPTGFVRGMWID